MAIFSSKLDYFIEIILSYFTKNKSSIILRHAGFGKCYRLFTQKS
ncbi:MAG: hypothetical protein ACI9VO_002019 [Colwellia sp.]|jgi:hypothetical protein